MGNLLKFQRSQLDHLRADIEIRLRDIAQELADLDGHALDDCELARKLDLIEERIRLQRAEGAIGRLLTGTDDVVSS